MFLAKSAKKSTPFLPPFERALQNLKKYLVEPQVLSKPRDGEPLYVYLLVIKKAISSVQVREDQKQQKPMYYVSKALQGA